VTEPARDLLRARPGNRRYLPVAVLGLLALGLWTGLPGLVSLVLDGHEVLVAETVKEMAARGDWIVPYFNDAPRLAKPPLSYWLTGLTAGIAGSALDVQAWQARVPSLVGGLAMLVCTYWAGRRLFDHTAGLLAALFMVSSLGFFAYARDARPDMLYAALCTLLLTAFVVLWQPQAGKRGGVYVIWFIVALATLAKGPHLPLMLVGACLLSLRLTGRSWFAAIRFLKPFSGLAFATVLAGWWWVALWMQLGTERLSNSQLSGGLLTAHFSALFDPYYFYRTFELVLPWLYVIPAVIWWLARGTERESKRWLITVLLVPMALLSLGVQKRPFYMLPLLMPLCVVLAVSAHRCWSGSEALCRLWRIGWSPFHLLLALILACYIFISAGAEVDKAAVIAVVFLVIGLLSLIAQRPKSVRMAATAVIVAIFAGLLGFSSLPWSDERRAKVEMAGAVAELLSVDTPVLSWKINPGVYVYYLKRPIQVVGDIASLDARLATAGEVCLLTAATELPLIEARYRTRLLGVKPGKGRDKIVAVMLTGKLSDALAVGGRRSDSG
jgi:4-amino-4-deoxy-L-arabinose transferase-like glycosyltransferase